MPNPLHQSGSQSFAESSFGFEYLEEQINNRLYYSYRVSLIEIA